MKLTNIRIITPRPICRSLSYVLITGCLLLGFSLSTRAFFPTNVRSPFGLLGKTHEKMTDEAITELDQEFFGINKLTTSMTEAIRQIVEANAAVDEDQKTAAKHFDGESLPEGQARIISLLNGIKEALTKDDSRGARIALGSALHTIQDFYSHTNWVELGNRTPHPGLGRPGNALDRLPATTATCVHCRLARAGNFVSACLNCNFNIITKGLTSGYYGGEDPPFNVKPPGKCIHGGFSDEFGKSGEGINKDSSSCTLFPLGSISPHHRWHEEAASLAKDATKQFIRDIKAAVTPRQLELLLGRGPTFGVAIGKRQGISMGSAIGGVKEQIIQIVNDRLGTKDEPSLYVLSPFDDSSVEPVTKTTDANIFIDALNRLSASDEGDCQDPELSEAGMLAALDASDGGADLFVFADASSKDRVLTDQVNALARDKDIRIYPMLFGSCSPTDPSYIKEADDTGGQLFSLLPNEAGSITQLADFIVRSNEVNLLLIDDTFAGTARTYTVPVDSTMTRITFSISGTNQVIVMRPSGSIVQASDPGVTVVSLSGGTIYSITNPAVGGWNVSVNGTGDVSVKVSGESSLDLSSFRFVELGGRPGHQGFFPIDGLPLAGQEGTVEAVMSGDFNTAQFELRSETGAVLQTLALSPVPETTDEFSGQVTPPTSSFRVYVTGRDITGANYQRLLSGSIRPQTVDIDAPVSQDLQPGQSLTYTFTITNLGPADTFSFTGSDDENYLTVISPKTFSLNTNESRDVTVQLQTPLNATPGTSDTLTISVASTGATKASNFAVVTSVVILGNPRHHARPRGHIGRHNQSATSHAVSGLPDPQ